MEGSVINYKIQFFEEKGILHKQDEGTHENFLIANMSKQLIIWDTINIFLARRRKTAQRLH